MSIEETILQEVKSGAKSAQEGLAAMAAHCAEFTGKMSPAFVAGIKSLGVTDEELAMAEAAVKTATDTVVASATSGLASTVETVGAEVLAEIPVLVNDVEKGLDSMVEKGGHALAGLVEKVVDLFKAPEEPVAPVAPVDTSTVTVSGPEVQS